MSEFDEADRDADRLARATRDWGPVLDAIGLHAVGQAQRSFNDQARGGLRWQERSTPNKAGIVADLAAGRDPPARRFEARPAGIDTGRLRGSIAYRVVSGETVMIGTQLGYARNVQDGGATTQEITPQVRTALAALLRARPELRPSLGFLFQRTELTTTQPARPFLKITEDDMNMYRGFVARHLRGAS